MSQGMKGYIHFVIAVIMTMSFLPSVSFADVVLPHKLTMAIRQLSKQKGFSCRFQQFITFSDGTSQKYSGSLAILPPNRFRWQYVHPYQQIIVSSGEKLWHYEPDLMQVRILTSLEDVHPVVMQLLAGRVGIDRLELLDSDTAAHRYHLRIKGGPTAWLGLSPQGLIAYVEMQDALGNRNRIQLDDCDMRPPAKGQFIFLVPKGVDVVKQ